jgi:hypothetical protein
VDACLFTAVSLSMRRRSNGRYCFRSATIGLPRSLIYISPTTLLLTLPIGALEQMQLHRHRCVPSSRDAIPVMSFIPDSPAITISYAIRL